jgi:hypothetical protein
MTYEDYKGKIYESLVKLLEVDYSDAQGIADAQEDTIAHCFSTNCLPIEAARSVDRASRSS